MILSDYLILAGLAVWAAAAVRSLGRKKGCGGGCDRCGKSCCESRRF